MTRKDYVLLALHLRQVLNATDTTGGMAMAQRGGVLLSIKAVANALASDNPRFDRDRFLEACGLLASERMD